MDEPDAVSEVLHLRSCGGCCCFLCDFPLVRLELDAIFDQLQLFVLPAAATVDASNEALPLFEPNDIVQLESDRNEF